VPFPIRRLPFRRPAHRGAVVGRLGMLLALALGGCAPARRAAHAPSPTPAQPAYRDSTLPLDDRLADLLRRMTLEEKVAQMEAIMPGRGLDSLLEGGDTADYGPAGARLGFGAVTGIGFLARGGPRAHAELANRLQRYFVERTRLGIPILVTDEALHGLVAAGATNYPTPLALSSTWDTALVHRVFSEVGLEAGSEGTDLVLAPVLDLAQDPRWGRTEETYGEDPYLNSRMGVAAIEGLQGDRAPFIDRRHVAATTKHFAGHGAPEGGRNIGPPHLSEHELREFHLRPFEAAVREAGVTAVMPAYHELFGVPVHASPFMLTEILRNEWGFRGIVVSDFFGIRYTYDTHRAARDTTEAARLAVVAGVDIDMPRLESYRRLVALVRSGRLDEALIDRAVRRILRAKFALGLFEHPYVDADAVDSLVATAAHLATARRAGDEAITLLRNEGGLLPLDTSRYRTIALIGPHADYAERGNYAGFPASSVTPLGALRQRLGSAARVLYAEGVELTPRGFGMGPARLAADSTNERLIREAADSARKADLVVLALGATARMMHEAWPGNEGDNDDLELRGRQNALVDSIRATGKPVVVLLFSGGPLSFAHIDRTMPVIAYCWYLGQETGNAVADVLLGDVNPSGRLPITIPRATGQLPDYYDHKPSARRQAYIFDDSSPLYPFGYGLGYTTFHIANVRLERDTIAATDSVRVFADVTNTGHRRGADVVQLYIRQDFTIPTRPVKELKGFARVVLDPGATATVVLPLTPAQLGHFDSAERFVVEPGTFRVMVGSSSRDEDLTVVPLVVR
jgi:beta-glucosidase